MILQSWILQRPKAGGGKGERRAREAPATKANNIIREAKRFVILPETFSSDVGLKQS